MISIGQKDELGNLLILGGWKECIWRTPSGKYKVQTFLTSNSEEAVEAYNLLNGTNLDLGHIWKRFEPWYEKQNKEVTKVPSASKPGLFYTVRRNPSGELSCECKGYIYRRDCWHIQAVRELSDGD